MHDDGAIGYPARVSCHSGCMRRMREPDRNLEIWGSGKPKAIKCQKEKKKGEKRVTGKIETIYHLFFFVPFLGLGPRRKAIC